MFRCHYNFSRPHRALKFGQEMRMPAMQAGLAERQLSDSLGQELKSKGIEPSASATLIQHRMQAADWRFVLTSDI